jgi:hypothetical protein
MKKVSSACLLAAALVIAHLPVTAAGAGRLRHVASIYADDKGAGLHLPEGIACGSDGQVVVGDTGNDRLLRFRYRDKAVSGGSEIKLAQLSSPARVQLNSKGEIYALNAIERRIVRLSSQNELAGVLEFDGVPAPATVVPKSFTIDAADRIYVLDVFAARVLVFDPQGQFQRALAHPPGTGFGSELAVDFAGNLLLLDSVRRRLYSAGPEATSFGPLGGDLTEFLATLPTYLAASKGVIFVVEGPGSSIVGFGRDGSFLSRQLSMGWSEGSLNHPGQLCINDRDDVFVADRDNSRIQVFQLMR